MSAILLLEQTLNSLQFGLMLFCSPRAHARVRDHGHDQPGARSLYMIGAYLMATFAEATGRSGWRCRSRSWRPRWWAPRWR